MRVEEAAALLQVDIFSSLSELRTAYYSAAKTVHPDLQHNDPSTTSSMAAYNEAYAVLCAYAKSRPKVSNGASRQHRDAQRFGRSGRRTAERERPPSASPTHNVVWAGPSVARSEFFGSHGFALRPTHDRVAFRVIANGSH